MGIVPEMWQLLTAGELNVSQDGKPVKVSPVGLSAKLNNEQTSPVDPSMPSV